MNYCDFYSEKLDVIKSIPDNEVLSPGSTPVSVYLQEAETLFNWCQPDKELLTFNGLDWSLVEDLPARADTLREAQAGWNSSRYSNAEAIKLWKAKSPAAHDLKATLLHSLKFLFKENSEVSANLKRLGKLNSNDDMIQALRDISRIGNDNIEFLKTTNFDIEQLKIAAAKSQEMAKLLGIVRIKKSFYNESQDLRDRCFTHLKNAVDKIKTHGRHVFWRNEARAEGYASDYHRKKNSKKKKDRDSEDLD